MRRSAMEQACSIRRQCLARAETVEQGQGKRGGIARRLSHSARGALIFASVFFQVGLLRAAPVGDAQAFRTASAYVGRNYAPSAIAKAARRLAAPAALAVSSCRPIAGAEGPLGFAVELSPSGFVLVRADDELPPIKLHSPSGSYEALPPGFRAVIEAELAGELDELASMRHARGKPDPRHRSAWQALTQAASPALEPLAQASALGSLDTGSGKVLLTTSWNQTSPYNFSAPVAASGSGGHASAGCGPVAMAQILRYHKEPEAPVSDFSYTDSEGGCTGTHRVSDAGGLGDYDWGNMPASVSSSSTLAQKQAVGRLLYHCGVAMQANFEARATSVTSQLFAARALREVFGYTCENYQSRAGFSTAAWFAKIQADVDAERPVYYAMASAMGGHALVCDGYRNGSEIHLNFGFSGYGDAWYNIDSIVFYNYVWSMHEAVFGIAPGTPDGSNTLAVVNGEGGGRYLASALVEVSADAPAEGYLFRRWTVSPEGLDLGTGFVQTQAVTVVTMPSRRVTLTAAYKAPNLPPAVTKRLPASELVTVYEGAFPVFSATADDSKDADVSERGMVSVTWYVDGVMKQETKTGAPAAVASAFTLGTDADTVQGEAFRELSVKAAATDRQGGVTEAVWVVRVLDNPVLKSMDVTAGAGFEMALPEAFKSAAKVVLKGLPTGLRYNASTRKISGVALRSGVFDVVFSAAGVPTQTVTFKVAAPPAWAQGAFSGYVEGGGAASMTVSAQGRVTGKLAFGGTNYTFSAASYAAGGSEEEGFSFTALAKAGKTALPLELRVAPAGEVPALGVAVGLCAGRLPVVMYRDVWSQAGATLSPCIGYYTASLPGGAEYGSGYLTFTVDKAGKVKVAGKLADGKALSLSGTLILDEAARVFAVLYAAPSAYKGGCLYGLAEFVNPGSGPVFLRLMGAAPFLWQSLSPQATGEYGAGFDRELEISGGMYGTFGNLYDYYRDIDLRVGTDQAAPAPELAVGANRHASAWWSPDGLALTAVTNRLGVMTGLAAPGAGLPADPDKDGDWDYGATNSVGLKISLARATGVFKGAFNAWFDYPVNKHVSKSVSYEGVLTPVREDKADGVEGRGFFLWPDQAAPPAPARPYAFKWSYDFLLIASP